MIRRLAASEFPVLATIHEGYVPDPSISVALVFKQEGEIVGRVFLLAPTHVEGPWVREDLRGGLIGHRLMESAEQEAKSRGITKLFAYAADDKLANYLDRMGYQKQPFTVWAKEI
jgi:N-acetylglutamate synthase-like GNAT family acetyltransferase